MVDQQIHSRTLIKIFCLYVSIGRDFRRELQSAFKLSTTSFTIGFQIFAPVYRNIDCLIINASLGDMSKT